MSSLKQLETLKILNNLSDQQGLCFLFKHYEMLDIKKIG